MGARTKARKRALDLLYIADLRGLPVSAVLSEERVRAANEPARRASWDYAAQIAGGYADHADQIDALISAHSHRWPLHRMPAVDRAILRVAAWELAHNPNVPAAAAISEARALATELSTDDSARFVAGVLSGIAQALGQDAREQATDADDSAEA